LVVLIYQQFNGILLLILRSFDGRNRKARQ